MQLVATIDTPFEDHLSVRKVYAFVDAFWQKSARAWDRLCKSFPETVAVTSVAVRTPVGIPGYYGGAYDRLAASMPMVLCFECVAADPFPQASTLRRGSCAVEKTETTPGPDGEQDPLYAVLCADWVMPARMM